MKMIELSRFHKQKFLVGCTLMALGVFMPLLIPVENFGIYGNLMEAIHTQNSIPLLYAGLKMVALNSLRSLPHYLGAFIMVESITFTRNNRQVLLLKSVAVTMLIPVVYQMIWFLFGIHHDFGVPAIVLILLILFLGRADYNLVQLQKKLLLVSFFIIAAQFLDIMPLPSSIPAGRGDMSKEIKYVAQFLDAESVLQSMALLFFFLFLLMGLMIFMLVRDENNLRAMNELKKENERMAMETRISNLEERTSLEMKHLVHDLKSPLTSAQALVGLVKLSTSSNGDMQNALYLEKVETAIERMSGMISELLNENYCTSLTVKELMDTVLAQISVTKYASAITLSNHAEDCIICVNKIRFVRALVNLVENASYALRKNDGRIFIGADRLPDDAHKVLLTVADEGTGMSPEVACHIWDSGFSGRGSHGLGLSFVKQVIDLCDGEIKIDSTEGVGTTVTIVLPEGEFKDESTPTYHPRH